MALRETIEALWEQRRARGGADRGGDRLLDRGELRVAEPGPDGWVVNEWAKKAILLYFRLRKVEPIDAGGLHYLDKIPSSTSTRRSACASCRRASRATARSSRRASC